MDDGNIERARRDRERPFFTAVLTPHRSLGRAGFGVLMAGVAAVSIAVAAAFSLIGAWPVVGFAGLDVALVALAFAANYHAARAYEEVAISPTEIRLAKVAPRGHRIEHRFNPLWVRLEVTRLDDEGVIRLVLRSRGEGVELGAFLNPDDRTSFAEALTAALHQARSGGPLAATGV